MPITDFQRSIHNFFYRKNPPFLFLGSGFSRRYLNLGNFKELLEGITQYGFKDFRYYESTSNGILPDAAELMANDFCEDVWKNSAFKDFLNDHKDKITKKHSAFKILIADHIRRNTCHFTDTAKQEIPRLEKANIDAIITTNYDDLIEKIFPNYKKFIGQDDLLSSNPQMVGEIYKIHGCITDEDSIIITGSDYKLFESKNKYLAAKLATAFVERPIVFIGYSIQDTNIQNIIQDIAGCSDKVRDRIQDNILFVNRANGGPEQVERAILTIGNLSVGYTKATTDDFGQIYSAMHTNRRKIPANYLRTLKEQLYELALHNAPTERLLVLSPDALELNNDVDFIVGVGIHSEGLGYITFSQDMTFSHIAYGFNGIDPRRFITMSAPNLLKRSKYIPIYRYLHAMGIHSKEALEASGLNLDNLKNATVLERNSYKPQDFYQRSFCDLKISKFSELISREDISNSKKILFATMIEPDKITEEKEIIEDFLRSTISGATPCTAPYKTALAKFVCYYDRSIYGWF